MTKRKTRKKPIDATNKITPPENIIGFKNVLKPRTINQKKYIRTVAENTVTFCQGVAGSGKTHIAVGMAFEHLVHGKVEKVVITRPIFPFLNSGRETVPLPRS